MTSCSGCGCVLGFKKYRFHKMWRIPGYYCKKCMKLLGQDFDDHGRLTLQQRSCDLCNVELFFPKTVTEHGTRKHYCDVCRQAVLNGVIPDKKANVPSRLPHVMMLFAGLGVLMMVLGLVFTLSSGGESSLANILFGSVTTALGFLLFKKTIRSRSLLLGRTRIQNDVEASR
jgi:hypothetical protein